MSRFSSAWSYHAFALKREQDSAGLFSLLRPPVAPCGGVNALKTVALPAP